ncbi:MAG: branched-chain amino acid transporter permease [Oscillospiraceae bacterium]|jgi:branched-subunit amino acid transport protein AzlD|nr:branched-chain amino acid transporter permease [Oscillospiraceae bacterium]
MNNTQLIITVIAIAAGVQITRYAPFLLFPAGKTTPKFVRYIGKVLPSAAISLLVIYSFKEVSVFSGTRGVPELIAAAVIIALHLWKRQMLLSIGAGTVLSMLLVQFVF